MAEIFDTEEFGRSLQRSSDEIKREVGALIRPAADEFAARLYRRYPLGRKEHPDRPHMKDDIRIGTVQGNDHLLPGRRVFGPRLAFIWQDGTVQRHDATRRNANRGRMPAADPGFFERTAVRVRSEMLNAAQVILDKPREIK
jgi:hypothetical protein